MRKIKNLSIPIKYEKKPKKQVPLMAFLFDRKGTLLEKIPVDKEKAAFKSTKLDLDKIRVFLAPSDHKGVRNADTIETLERYSAFEPVLDLNKAGKLELLPIPGSLSDIWNLRFCRVRGKVTKDFMLHGINQERGICKARVHICEVDRIRLLLPRIPDLVIDRIPDIVFDPKIPIPFPDPIPDPIPRPFPDPIGPVIDPVALTTRIESFQPRKITAQPVLRSVLDGAAKITKNELLEQLKMRDVSVTRNLIAENFEFFHPYFCHIPWLWPYFYRCDEIATVYTDVNGRFDTTILYLANGDHPDLYFWVEYLIDGIWTTVYRPPIPCNTYWNFACGSEIGIKITDDRVRWECNDVIDGDIVWIKTIGNSASVSHIKQEDDLVVKQGKLFNQIGLTDTALFNAPNAAGDFRRPFGASLSFVVQFGSGVPTNDVKYYRWSWRKVRNGDLTPAFGGVNYFTNSQYKHYTFEFFDTFGDKQFDTNSFKLGPNLVNGQDLYFIPPVNPAMAPVNAPELSPLWNQNTVAVSFDSTSLDGDGLYEFEMELFDKDGNIVKVPKADHFFRVPTVSTFSPSVKPQDKNLQLDGTGKVRAFQMLARIDNNACFAQVYPAKVDGVVAPASDCCGFNEYISNASPIELSFTASHPYNLATFSFNVSKGTCPDALSNVDTSGMVIGSTANYARDGASKYTNTETVGSIMGTCEKAAFAEVLRVHTLAINGTNRLSGYDRGANAAFALEPKVV